ncbi:MAG TPA: hypothetical protein VM144_09895 [Aestuariivirga sp.]|nr:hypothetical protein [Aestuariivirga sp.]
MIIRRKHSGNFAVIPNATADDERLAADTLGTLVYLLAKPEDWKVIVADIRRRFGIGRNRVYAIMLELEGAGYVRRFQNRAAHSQFSSIEYHVFDCPQVGAGEADMVDEGRDAEIQQLANSPLPQNGDTVETQQNTVSPLTVYRETASPKRGHILNTKSTNSLRGKKPSAEAGELSPSINQEVWKEGFDLLKTTSLNPNRSIIGKWLKRASTKKDGKKKLLAMIRAAVAAGTLDPIAYISKALDSEFPPLPQPKQFNHLTWQRNIIAAVKTKDWPQAWGPAPGKKGCLVPPELITDELTTVLAGWRAAA